MNGGSIIVDQNRKKLNGNLNQCSLRLPVVIAEFSQSPAFYRYLSRPIWFSSSRAVILDRCCQAHVGISMVLSPPKGQGGPFDTKLGILRGLGCPIYRSRNGPVSMCSCRDI